TSPGARSIARARSRRRRKAIRLSASPESSRSACSSRSSPGFTSSRCCSSRTARDRTATRSTGRSWTGSSLRAASASRTTSSSAGTKTETSRGSGCRTRLCPRPEPAALLLGGHHELLELAVRHLERRDAESLLRELRREAAKRHAAAERPGFLRELLELAQGAEAGREVPDCLVTEVGACVRREERAVEFSELKAFEDLLRLFHRLIRTAVRSGEQRVPNLLRDVGRGLRRVEVDENDDGCALVGIDVVSSREARNLSAVRDQSSTVDESETDAEPVA